MIKFTKTIAVSAAALAVATLPTTAASAAVIVYQATNYEAGAGKHGLWTNNTNSGSARFYAFQPDMLFTIDTNAGTGTMTGTAINGSGNVATINLSLGGFLETTDGSGLTYKQQGGSAYDEVNDVFDVDFFSTGSGVISIDGYDYTLRANPYAESTAFQYGQGANAKNGAFGGSAWLLVTGEQGEMPNHWDLNFNLSAMGGVPEPSTWAMLIFGFGAIGAGMRRKKANISVSYA